ncbi:MAG: hypothetical protein HC905_10615 [Bacteroidales bacterium]|nr:hypothetical protein [Bacteroidales bacterium]
MNRKEYIQRTLQLGVCSCAMLLPGPVKASSVIKTDEDEQTKMLRMQRDFLQNWLADFMEAADREVDAITRVKLYESTGRGCYNRHKFKQDIAEKGKGDLDKLIEAYKQNFEIWKEGDKIHIRYGEVNAQCYCPAAKSHDPKPNDIHCECTRTTHQTIFETALCKPVKVNILESFRRGGKTCHFLVEIIS